MRNQRIAVPTIGGIISCTVLALVVIPAIYSLAKSRGRTWWMTLAGISDTIQ